MNDSELQQLIAEYQVPQHVQKHSEKVAQVALFLGRRLAEKGEIIDLDLIRQAALLHDLVRVCDMRNFDPENFEPSPTVEQMMKWNEIRGNYADLHHADAAYHILNSKGCLKLAEIIKRHKFISVLDPAQAPRTWEEKLVYYADKRVVHGDIQDLSVRIKEGKERNLRTAEEFQTSDQAATKIYQLEKEIFDRIGIDPSDINRVN